MPDLQINGTRLLDRLRTLGGIGRDAAGRLTRLAGSDSDKLGRDALVDWIREGGLTVRVDHIGNVFGLWESPENAGRSAILVGSHIDTVIDAGIYDGCYGVLAGLEVIEALRKARFEPAHPIAVAAFTNVKPAAINVIPSEAAFTIDLRDPTEGHLARLEAELTERFDRIAAEEGLSVTVDRLARTLPVSFDPSVVGYIEAAALGRGLTTLRMTSGAGHDAQMMARICPAAMIFVPSRHGISHNPREFTDDASLAIGANVLLDVVSRLAMGTGLLGS